MTLKRVGRRFFWRGKGKKGVSCARGRKGRILMILRRERRSSLYFVKSGKKERKTLKKKEEKEA